MTIRTYNNRRFGKDVKPKEVEETHPPHSTHIQKPLEKYDFGFVVLCPERNLGGYQNTVRSINHQYPNAKIIGVVGNDVTTSELAEMDTKCETVMGQDTITSLINVGMKNSKAPWNVIVFAGSWVRGSVYRKFEAFVRDKRDILFPVVDGHYNFVDGSMNGIIIHQDTFAEVGDFSTHNMQKEGHNDLELIKLWWALGAMEKGCLFKAIIGMEVV